MTVPAVLRADARSLPLADDTVDLVVTSPPYFGLRSYQDGGEHYNGQVGDEPTPAEYVATLIECTRECMRVLKPTGSLFVNLGDKYAAKPGAGPNASSVGAGRNVQPARNLGIPPKSLIGLPWRYALACIDQLGLILRAEMIWSKPSGLPESVTDRVRRSHEQWFHFTLQPRYFAAVDEIREQHARQDPPRPMGTRNKTPRHTLAADYTGWKDHSVSNHDLGKLPGSVREVASRPLTVPDHLNVDHFAAFPVDWPLWIIQGWSPAGICTACGEGRRPVSSRTLTTNRKGRQTQHEVCALDGGTENTTLGWERDVRITGYACGCPEPSAPTRPAVVVDPFGGTGTTALAASVLGRRGISVDLSSDYCRLAQWRTTDPGERARALGLPKPEPIPDEQLSLDLPA